MALASATALALTGCASGFSEDTRALELYNDKGHWASYFEELGELSDEEIGLPIEPVGYTDAPTYEAFIKASFRTNVKPDLFTWSTGGRLEEIVEPGHIAQTSDIVYLSGLSDGWYEVTDPDSGLGLRVDWDVRVLPYLWMWQEFGGSTGYSWWGRAYTVGSEPFLSYPTNGLSEAVGNGTALPVDAGAERSLRWSVQLLG